MNQISCYFRWKVKILVLFIGALQVYVNEEWNI